jgi:hypothetical protein
MATKNLKAWRESLGLRDDATSGDIVAAVSKMVMPDEPDVDDGKKDKHANDPRALAAEYALTEVRKSEAAGRPLSYTDALARVRAANPRLNEALKQYEYGADHQWSGFSLTE